MACRTPLASPLILWRGSCFSLTGLPSSEFSLISLHIEFILPSFPPIIWRRRTILPDSILRRMTGSPSPQIPDTSRILVTYYLIQGNNGILDKDNFSHSLKRVVQGPLCCWKCFIYHRLCTVGFSPPDTLVCPYVWLHSAATHWDCFGAALPCSTLWNTSLFDKAVLDT